MNEWAQVSTTEQLIHKVWFVVCLKTKQNCELVNNLTSVLSLRTIRCGNVAAILELDEHLQREFIIFEAAPQETRGIPSKKPVADYFLWRLWEDSHDV